MRDEVSEGFSGVFTINMGVTPCLTSAISAAEVLKKWERIFSNRFISVTSSKERYLDLDPSTHLIKRTLLLPSFQQEIPTRFLH